MPTEDQTPEQQPPLSERERYENALEKTAAAADFSTEGLRREIEATAFERTPEQTASQFLRRTHTDDSDHEDYTSTHELTRFSETHDLPPAMAGEQRSGPRFEVKGEVGAGATSRVYAVHDHSLNRTVAVKLLRRSTGRKETVRRRFVREARVTAMLEHPNIVPVHDIGLTGTDEVFLAMKNVTGVSMGEAIRAAREGKDVPQEFSTSDGIVRIFIKICDALSYAHNAGFIHQDVKPDNIMLGAYGEVLLLDWGSAIEREESLAVAGRGLYGTPAYMSPEQARRERADARSDVYCVGATLFHALLLRHPSWADEPEEFWEKKRAGIIDEVTAQERRRAPAALIDIALKAMKADAEGRYQSVDELARDLKQYQAGLAVRAHRESPFEAFARWYRHNRRVFWISAAATALVLGAGTLLLREKIKEWVTWRLIYEEDFEQIETQDLSEHWSALLTRNWVLMTSDSIRPGGAWVVEDGALMARCEAACHNLAFRKPVTGNIRVEWDVTPLYSPLNLNCFIAGSDRFSGYTFHVGTNETNRIELTRARGGVIERVIHPTGVQFGRVHRMRMEKEGKHIRLFMNGKKVIDYFDPDIIDGVGHQSFGFENNNGNALRIDNIRVYYHPLPLKVSPLATPDYLFEQGLYERALALYRAIADAYPLENEGAEARYKIARSLWKLGALAAADTVYERYLAESHSHDYFAQALYDRSLVLRHMGDTVRADSLLGPIAQRFPGHSILRTIVFDMSARALADQIALLDTAIVDSVSYENVYKRITTAYANVTARAGAFGVSLVGNTYIKAVAIDALSAAFALDTDSIAAAFKEHRAVVAELLYDNGQYEDVVNKYRDRRDFVRMALLGAGQYELLLERLPEDRTACAAALNALGRHREVLTTYSDIHDETARAMLALGQYDTVLARYTDRRWACAQALMRLGRGAEAVGLYADYGTSIVWAAVKLGLLDTFLMRNSLNAIVLYETYRDVYRNPELGWKALVDGGGAAGVFGFGYYGPQTWVDREMPEEAIRRFPKPDRSWNALAMTGKTDSLRHQYPRNLDLSVHHWRHTGRYDSVLIRAGTRPQESIMALVRAGEVDRIVELFPFNRKDCAAALVDDRQYERVLKDYPDQRASCALALVGLGRGQEVLERYRDQSYACAVALTILGREDEALDKYPDFSYEMASILYRSNGCDCIAEQLPYRVLENALCHLRSGRPDRIPFEHSAFRMRFFERTEVYHTWAIREYIAGKRRRADSLFALETRHWYGEDTYHNRFGSFMLRPILRALDGDTGALPALFALVDTTIRYRYAQTLWHESAFLAGRITHGQYLAQPHGMYIKREAPLFEAIRAELDGDRAAALRGYQAFLDDPILPLPSSTVPVSLTLTETARVFAQWRVEVLASNARVTR